MQQVSRRSFIKGAGLSMAAITAAGCTTMTMQDAYADEEVTDEVADGISWDYEADVVVLGAGGSGLPAALKAIEDGASVIIVEANWDVGGHTAVSAGNLHSGAGTEIQKEFGIEDSADQYYIDHTWGELVVSRTDDRDYVRAIADNMVEAYDFIQEKGVVVLDAAPTYSDGSFFDPEREGQGYVGGCDSVPRQTVPDTTVADWESYRGKSEGGIFITRPLEQSLRQSGGQFLMNYHMDRIIRESNNGRILGIMASYTPHIMPGDTEPLGHLMTEGDIETTQDIVYVKANKGVIVCTGGSTGNLTMRTAFDPRLGPEFDGLAGMPFSDQDGSGEIAAMKIGASLGTMGSYNQHGRHQLCFVSRVGCRYGYGNGFTEASKVWPLVVANGVDIDFDNMVLVNMLGQRVGNNDIASLDRAGADEIDLINEYSGENYDWFNNALGSVVINPEGDGNAVRYAGPIWAIFDQATCDAHDWGELTQGTVDYDNGYCFKADTLEELAEKVINKYYEDVKMDPDILVETITNWNSYVDAGEDPEWGTTWHLVGKVETPPYYCAWATPSMHDCYSGLRVNNKMQVLDFDGEPIEGLYAAGESSAGSHAHGHGRVITSGYIAGRSAANEETGPAAPGSVTAGNAITTTMEVYGTVDSSDSGDTDIVSGEISDGTYTGSSPNGQGGEIQVEITVDDGVITNIDVVKQNETESIGGAALPILIDEALEFQSSDIEAITGATVTSNAFSEALATAMRKAGF